MFISWLCMQWSNLTKCGLFIFINFLDKVCHTSHSNITTLHMKSLWLISLFALFHCINPECEKGMKKAALPCRCVTTTLSTTTRSTRTVPASCQSKKAPSLIVWYRYSSLKCICTRKYFWYVKEAHLSAVCYIIVLRKWFVMWWN